MGGHGIAVYADVMPHHPSRLGEDGYTLGCGTFDLDNGTVLGVDHEGSFDQIGSLAFGVDSQGKTLSSIDKLNASGFQLHLIIGGGEP